MTFELIEVLVQGSQGPKGEKGDIGDVTAEAELARDIAQSAADAALIQADVSTSKAEEAQNAVATGRVLRNTLTELNASIGFPEGAVAEVVADTINNGYYRKTGASGAGSWEKVSAATVPALDARVSEVTGTSWEIVDDKGFTVMRFDASGITIARMLASLLTTSRLQLGSDAIETQTPGVIEIIDPEGSVLARYDEDGLTVGAVSTKAFDVAGNQIRNDSPVDYTIEDEDGWVLLAIINGVLRVPAIQTDDVLTGGDYTADEIAERNGRALALAALLRARVESSVTAPAFGYSQVFVYGQSLGAAQESWPAKTLSGRSDVLMLGQSTRPAGADGLTSPSPLSDTTLRPAVGTVQNGSTGVLIDAAGQAALTPGDAARGEDPGVGAIQFARRLFLQHLGQLAADDRRFIVTNVAVSGRTVEQLSKGASPELFNRLRVMATAVKNAATALSASYGVAAMLWFQGEWNITTGNGGTADKATYKALLKQLRADFNADVGTTIAAQADPPAFITYQTGAQYTVDGLNIGQAQWELAQEEPGWFLAAPAYQFPDKGGHLDPNGSRWMGLQMGKVFHEVCVLRRPWRPNSPIRAGWRGRTVLVDFHTPHAPLQFQPVAVGQVLTTFANKGFTAVDAVGTVPLSSVEIVGDAVVRLIATRDLSGPVTVSYAQKTTFNGHGNLCDSDPTLAPFNYEYQAGSGDYAAANIAAYVGKPYPLWNWCIAFTMTATAE